MDIDVNELSVSEEHRTRTWTWNMNFQPVMLGQIDSIGPAVRDVVLGVSSYVFAGSTVTDEEANQAARRQGSGAEAQPEYFFKVKHVCSFNATALWVMDEAHRKGYYVKEYEIKTSVVEDNYYECQEGYPYSAAKDGYINVPKSMARLVAVKPATGEAVVNHSASAGQSVNIGAMGSDPMGGGSLDSSSSVSYSVNDVTVVSEMNQDPIIDGAHWKLQLTPAPLGDLNLTHIKNLGYPASVSHETFTPELIEHWVLPHPVGKQFNLRVEITVKIEYRENHIHGIKDTCTTHPGSDQIAFFVSHPYAALAL